MVQVFHCFPIFIVFWGIFRNTNGATMCQNSVFFVKFGGCQNEVFEKNIAFFVFSFSMLENGNRKKKKMEKAKNPIKIAFLRCSSKNVKNQKNGFLAKLTDTICVRKGKKTRIFVHTICFGQIFLGPKKCKAGNTIKIGVSAEIAKKKTQNTKMTPFFGKRCFLTWLKKVGFTNCVFEKLCFLKTQFL